jgi:hypothetical protein
MVEDELVLGLVASFGLNNRFAQDRRDRPAMRGQIEVCDRHAQVVIERHRSRGLDVLDRRDWQ